MIVGAGVLVGAALYAAAPGIFRLMGAEGEFAALAVQYLRVYALCSPVTTIIFAVDNYLRICGYIRGSMLLNLLMSGLSAALEFLFLGVFRFGIWGARWPPAWAWRCARWSRSSRSFAAARCCALPAPASAWP